MLSHVDLNLRAWTLLKVFVPPSIFPKSDSRHRHPSRSIAPCLVALSRVTSATKIRLHLAVRELYAINADQEFVAWKNTTTRNP